MGNPATPCITSLGPWYLLDSSGCHSLTALFHFGYTTWKQSLDMAVLIGASHGSVGIWDTGFGTELYGEIMVKLQVRRH